MYFIPKKVGNNWNSQNQSMFAWQIFMAIKRERPITNYVSFRLTNWFYYLWSTNHRGACHPLLSRRQSKCAQIHTTERSTCTSDCLLHPYPQQPLQMASQQPVTYIEMTRSQMCAMSNDVKKKTLSSIKYIHCDRSQHSFMLLFTRSMSAKWWGEREECFWCKTRCEDKGEKKEKNNNGTWTKIDRKAQKLFK